MSRSGLQHTLLPVARSDDLIVSFSGEEVIAYDQRAHHIHHLNPMAAAIWRACDGEHEVNDLAERASVAIDQPVGPDAVRLTLAQLDEADLLEDPLAPELKSARQSRRALLRKAGAAAAIPAIVSVSAPSAAIAASGCGVLGNLCAGPGCCHNEFNVDLEGCCVEDSEFGWVCDYSLSSPCAAN